MPVPAGEVSLPMGRVVTEAELVAWGEELGRTLAPPQVVWLQGDLGAGKTTVTQAIVRGFGVRSPATSPTYDLVHRYDGARGPVYHVDCYRLHRSDDAADLDWETLATAALLLIEWPERAGDWAPPPTRVIRLAHAADPDVRRLEVEIP